jgi:hypothetical protein
MNITVFINSLTPKEKRELFLALQKDFVKTPPPDDLIIEDWIKTVKLSTRLKNILMRNFRMAYVSDITEYDFRVARDAGDASWAEFERLRGGV